LVHILLTQSWTNMAPGQRLSDLVFQSLAN
jgi:hypothetical protein